jgi:hypothetical protein
MDHIKSAFKHDHHPNSFNSYEDCPHQINLAIKSSLSRKGAEEGSLSDERSTPKIPHNHQPDQLSRGSFLTSIYCTQQPRCHELPANYVQEFNESFSELKRSLATLIVVPSHDVDTLVRRMTHSSVAKYEERQLYNLLLLHDNPNLRVIYVSSEKISDVVIGYYLRLGSNKDTWRDQLSRLTMLSVNDSSFSATLSQKILERPQILRQLQDMIFQTRLKTSTLPNQADSLEHENVNIKHYVGLSVYTGSSSCSLLSEVLGLPLLEADQACLHWGTKQGSREIFYASQIPFPRGTPDIDCGDFETLLTTLPNATKQTEENNEERNTWEKNKHYIRSSRALSMGLARQIMLKNVRPQSWIIKLNQGSCGSRTATLNLTDLQNDPRYQADKLSESRTLFSAALANGIFNQKLNELALGIENRLPLMQFNDPSVTWETGSEDDHPGFRHQMYRLGAICEELMENVCGPVRVGGEDIFIQSPSFQGIITVNDKTWELDYCRCKSSVHVVSTHEQVLRGIVFVGCEMPAAEPYRTKLIEYGLKIGYQLADRGVLGHYSVDFLAIPRLDIKDTEKSIAWDLVAIEINLRQGGTTHPHAIMEALVGGGSIDKVDGTFKIHEGNIPRYYVATDAFTDPLLKGLSPEDLISAIESEDNPDARRLHWDQSRKVGTVFYLFRALKAEGKIGFTCIGATREEAKSLFNSTICFILHLAANKSKDTAPSAFIHCEKE